MKTKMTITLVLAGILLAASACSIKPASRQTVEVERGNLSISVTGSGDIEASHNVRLSFSSSGKVAKVYVREGDKVKKGDQLAQLETDALELALTQAKVAVSQARIAETEAKAAASRAEVGLRTTEYDLNQALEHYTWPDIKAAQTDVDDAKAYIDYVSLNAPGALGYARVRLVSAETRLDALINVYDSEEVAIKKLQVATANQSLELAKQSLEPAQQFVKQAERAEAFAQKQLAEAVITAPFDGVVASVGPRVGDTVAPTVIMVQLVDASSLDLIAEIDEMDVPKIKAGQKAVTSIDALPGNSFNGTVVAIYPLPKTSTGLVSYNVRITLEGSDAAGAMAGMNAKTAIVVGERTNVLTLPAQAIISSKDGKHTVKVVNNGTVLVKEVIVGISSASLTEIAGGLSEGEKVVEQ